MPRPLRILSFDIENRPLSYLGSDFTTSDITIIAWGWAHDPASVTYVAQPETSLRDMLSAFVTVYDQADIVTGHYVLGHDLPIINGALLELGASPLNPKMVTDTKVHLVGRKGISVSQESLGAMLGLEHQKFHMTQAWWRQANRLEPDGVRIAVERCVSDVREHLEMRQRLVELDWLKPPTYYRGGDQHVEYTP